MAETKVHGACPPMPHVRPAYSLIAWPRRWPRLSWSALLYSCSFATSRLPTPSCFFVLRVVLSFSAATLGATIPGFLDIRWFGSGLAIRAGGALALFVLTFVYTPDVLMDQGGRAQTTISAPGGVASQSITGSPITINPSPPAQTPTK